MTHPNSFQVLYASRISSTMSNWVDTQNKINEENRLKVQNNVYQQKQEYRRLESRHRLMSCDKIYDKYLKEYKHPSNCEKCNIKSKMDNINVAVHENNLPEDKTLQYTIAFDVNLPEKIANLYEAIYAVNLYFNNLNISNKKTYGSWNDEFYSSKSSIQEQKIVSYTTTNHPENGIIDKLIECKINYFFDVGAIIENSKFPQIWFKRVNDNNEKKDGIAYFENNKLKYYDGESMFDFHEIEIDLSNCLVFLDQYHTRGTDMKYPPNAVAAVSLEKNLMRDDIAQGCMRLRMLMNDDPSKKQSVIFYKPDILKLTDKYSSPIDVLSWSIQNTNSVLSNHAFLWLNQGLIFGYNKEKERDSHTLMEMYDKQPSNPTLINILEKSDLNYKLELYSKIKERISEIPITILNVSNLTEEQERELEKEMEEEYEIERPPTKIPHQVKLHPDILKLVNGEFNPTSDAFVCFPIFINARIKTPFYCTKEFISIFKIPDEHPCHGIAIRPTAYICVCNNSFILLHQYEASYLLQYTKFTHKDAKKYFGLQQLVPRIRGVKQPITLDRNPFIFTLSCPEFEYAYELVLGSIYYENLFPLCDSIGLVVKGIESQIESRSIARDNKLIGSDGFGTLNGSPHSNFLNSPIDYISWTFHQKFEKYDGGIKGTHLHSLIHLQKLP